MNHSGIVTAKLENGTLLHVEALGHGETDVAQLGPLDFKDVTAQIESFAQDLNNSLDRVTPTRATVEFGCTVGVESGKLIAILIKGTVAATLKVTLEWDRTT